MSLRAALSALSCVLVCGGLLGCGNTNASSGSANQIDSFAPETIDYGKCTAVQPGSSGPMLMRSNAGGLHANIIGGIPLSTDGSTGSRVLAVISHPPSSTSLLSLCTGSLIAPNIILTAAHCFESENDVAQISFSRSPFCDAYYGDNQNTRNARKILIHPNYNSGDSSTESSDVALVLLDGSAPGSANVVPLDDADNGVTTGNDFLYGIGYGRTVGTKVTTTDPPELHGGNLVLTSSFSNREQAFLNQIDPGLTHFFVVSNTAGVGICHGDSGGPLLVNRAGILRQIGVASFVLNAPDGGSSTPLDQCGRLGAYVRIKGLLPWIHEATLSLESDVNSVIRR